MDDTLQTICKHFLPIYFNANEIVQKIISQMTNAFQITLPDGNKIVYRGKLASIEFKVKIVKNHLI